MKKKVLILVAALLAASWVFAQRVSTQSGYSVLYDDGGRAMLVVADSAPSLPVPPNENALLYRTDEQKFYQWSNGAWSSALSIAALTGDLTGDVTGNLTGDVTGSISGGTLEGTVGTVVQTRIDHEDAAIGTAADCGKTIGNTGDDDGSGYTLPDGAPAGCRIKIVTAVAQTFTITVASGEAIFLGPDECTADTLTFGAIGDNAVIEVLAPGDSGVWLAEGDAGSTGAVCDDT